ncbi:CD1375 family protein, partial [Clostridioides difficile]
MIKIDKEKIEKSRQRKELDDLDSSQKTQDNDITDLMLATAEICEMVLSSQQASTMSLKNI